MASNLNHSTNGVLFTNCIYEKDYFQEVLLIGSINVEVNFLWILFNRNLILMKLDKFYLLS